MSEQFNPALGDEKLAADFLHGLTRTNLPEGAVFFWMQAGHLADTGILYNFDDAGELFEKVKDVTNGE